MTFFDFQYQRLETWRDLDVEFSHSDPDLVTSGVLIGHLELVERFWAYPGRDVIAQLTVYLASNSLSLAQHLVRNVVVTLQDNRYRTRFFLPYVSNLSLLDKPQLLEHSFLEGGIPPFQAAAKKPYFEVLIVHPFLADYEDLYEQSLANLKTDRDEFLYDLVFVDSVDDAILAVLSNPSIQSVVMLAGISYTAKIETTSHVSSRAFLESTELLNSMEEDPLLGLNRALHFLRPELDLIFISEVLPTQLDVAYQTCFNRILYHVTPFPDLHFYILNGIRDRFSTPFFHALQAYSRRPKGMFHALPISRGHSLQDSPWITDLVTFYGPNIFLAETSSTQGGLDSLLDPKGAIKQAHNEAARAFGAQHTYFVTNGTSTANKIVLQATLAPADVVLVSSDCHKSIPYAVMLSGAVPVFLAGYSLDEFDLYGAIPLSKIKAVLLEFRAKGELHRVKQLTLTNSTFDGLVYNIERYMLDILAIKPDIIFHFDEAWFAFAHFNPLYRHRTGMSVARQLQSRFSDPSYSVFYDKWVKSFSRRAEANPELWIEESLYPDPTLARIRVYVTQSTHKTLTAFRQGSMIHVWDDDFNEDRFFDAYRIHTSTSPNYQILASLDVGRRQASLEGYERVKHTLYLSHFVRSRIAESELLRPFFKVLDDTDLVPSPLCGSEMASPDTVYSGYCQRWKQADVVVDPTRITVDVRGTGMQGGSFRELLINRYDIQVNKTSRFTVLFIINIGSTQESADYLLQVLHDIAERLLSKGCYIVPGEDGVIVPLPKERLFHPSFGECLRESFYSAFEAGAVTYLTLNSELIKDVLNGKEWVSGGFVTPYPPGVPVLVPGQLITYDILMYLQSVKNKEIHGYNAHVGLKVFSEVFLGQLC